MSTKPSFAPNTERARRSDWNLFRAWCDEEGVAALPASTETIAAFVEATAKDRRPRERASLHREHRGDAPHSGG